MPADVFVLRNRLLLIKHQFGINFKFPLGSKDQKRYIHPWLFDFSSGSVWTKLDKITWHKLSSTTVTANVTSACTKHESRRAQFAHWHSEWKVVSHVCWIDLRSNYFNFYSTSERTWQDLFKKSFIFCWA